MDPEIGSGKSFAPGQTFSEGERGYANPGNLVLVLLGVRDGRIRDCACVALWESDARQRNVQFIL